MNKKYLDICGYLSKTPIFKEKCFDVNRRYKILNSFVDVFSINDVLTIIEDSLNKNKGFRIISLNSFKLEETNNNPYLNQILNNSSIINPDGFSIIMAMKKIYKKKIERCTGIDLMNEVFKIANKNENSIYLFGSSKEVINKVCEKTRILYPNINVYKHDGYFEKYELNEIIKEIQSIKPNFILVGISSPLKEYLINYLQHNGIKSIILGVGGSFEVFAGNRKRAPKILQEIGLEWFYRLLQEPKRLFKRYLICNTHFFYRLMKEGTNNG